VRILSIGSIKPVEGFEDRLKLEFDILSKKGFNVTLKKNYKGNAVFFYCYIEDEIILKENHYKIMRQTFVNSIANALSDIVMDYWEPILIKKIIRDNCFYFNEIEQNRIYDFTLDIANCGELNLTQDTSSKIKRKICVVHKIREYLADNNIIMLDGFIDFRLREYMEQLEELVDTAIDEYLIDREYKEFIDLLRYFVDLQEPKRDLVNVVFCNTKIILMDEDSKFIENDLSLDLLAQENDEVSTDDIVISTLINIAPRKIIIHGFTGEDKIEVINTIYNIFEGRIHFCNSCNICLKSKPLTTK